MSLTVAIVGRPNVGKSTLFNRLVGRRLAIVDDTPGVTRDWRSAEARLGSLAFTAIDTAGLENVRDDSLEARMRRQTERVLARVDVVLFLIDARAGLTPLDRHFAEWLRTIGKPLILVANKAEARVAMAGVYESFELGLGEPVAISAEHGEGMGDLADALFAYAEPEIAEPEIAAPDIAAPAAAPPGSPDPEPADPTQGAVAVPVGAAPAAAVEAGGPEAGNPGDDDPGDDDQGPGEEEEEEHALKIAIVGRPNVGKSTLLNALLGEERVLADPVAGTTRDAIAVDWTWRGRLFRLVDTAGLRKRARVDNPLEKLATAETLRAIRLAQVVILVVDAAAVLDRQDLTIARLVMDEGRALVLAVNKWDAALDRTAALKQVRDRLEASLSQARGVSYVTLSALKGEGMDRLLETVTDVYGVWTRRISTSKLNRWLAAMTERHPPPLVEGRRVKIRYMTQIKARPPTFALWVNQPAAALPEAYRRYLVQNLREDFALPGVPIRLLLRKSDNPFKDKAEA